jgi:hypothetical protein
MTGGVAEGVEGFAERYPRVWHVMEAEGAGCETLYPAATLRCLAGMPPDPANRDDFQLLTLQGGSQAILRKQLMPDKRLRPTLAGIFSERPGLWRHHIDQHVFFWVTNDRRDRFVSACARSRARGAIGSGLAPVVIDIDTASLLAAHHEVAFFSRINTGSAILGGARTRRDEATLRPLHSWRGERAVELAIRGPVPISTGGGGHSLAGGAAAWTATLCGASPGSTEQ